ncbi:MAG: redoxin domain-containing protein [Prolixibacteraceae bacterium]|nr:redoxin domain-containing protein [Prolixibacteraceae bacterium]
MELYLPTASGNFVKLTYYYGRNIYVKDSILIDNQGIGTLKYDTLLPQGIYKIYFDPESHFDFLLGKNQKLKISNPGFDSAKLTIDGAIESIEFQKYLAWIAIQQQEKQKMEMQRKEAPEKEQQKIDKQIATLNKDVIDYWQKKSKQYPGSFLGAFLMSNYFADLKMEDVPQEIADDDSLLWHYQYNYRKDHFFDYYDLTDARFLYTPSLKSKLDTYFEKVLLQTYDSIKPAAYRLIEKVKPTPSMYRFVLSYLINSSLNSHIMGLDALFVDLADDFYLSGEAAWADSVTLEKIRENKIFIENNLIGKTARDFKMKTNLGDDFRLYTQTADYLIVVFYEPNCSHCREFVPLLHNDIYLPFRDKGVGVVAVNSIAIRDDWDDFIEEYDLHDWHNVWDEHHISRFRVDYDVRMTPKTYLLDKNKKIVAKKCSIEFLKQVLPILLGESDYSSGGH